MDIGNKTEVAKWGGERNGLKSLGLVDGWQMQIITFRMDKQQVPNVQLRELYSISCDKP